MKIAIGSDHAGFDLKEKVKGWLKELGHEAADAGPAGSESTDYPEYAHKVARLVRHREADRGVLICGTGIGMSMVANKVPGIRAAVCHSEFTCEMSRRHNDANVLCLGSRVVDERMVEDLVRLFVHTPFEGGRHLRRVKKINDVDRLR